MAYATALIYFFGKLFHPYPIIDICIGILALVNFIKNIKNIRNKKNQNIYFTYFLIYTLITARFLSITSFLYFLRLASLLSFFIFPPQFSKKFKYFFKLIIISNIIFGLIQYFFWPNFTYFNSLNWDPHLFRLVSTFLDPTFTGLIYLMFIITLYFIFPHAPNYLIIPYIALSLTYSRSSLLSFICCFSYISIKLKNKKIFLTSLIILTLTIFLLPRLEGEGSKLERTSSIKAKIENYRQAIVLYKKSPIIGVGYNNLPHVRDHLQANSHSNSGFDGSLMTILTTTGIIGLILFCLGLKQYFISSDLLHKTLIIAIIIHSLFSNSLLYPWTLLFLIFI
jgi:hypothetical protein